MCAGSLFKVPITSKKKFFSADSTLHPMNFCKKKVFDLLKTQFFYEFLKTFKFAPFWSTIRTSLPQFEVSCDIDSGARGLNHDFPDL